MSPEKLKYNLRRVRAMNKATECRRRLEFVLSRIEHRLREKGNLHFEEDRDWVIMDDRVHSVNWRSFLEEE